MTKVEVETSNKNILLFDGVCNFCNSTVIFILKRDKKSKIAFAALQSDSAKELLKKQNIIISEDPESAILFKKGKIYTKSGAAIEVLRTIGGVYSLAVLLKIFPSIIRDQVYDFISKNRYKWFGKRNSCIVPGPEIKHRFLN